MITDMIEAMETRTKEQKPKEGVLENGEESLSHHFPVAFLNIICNNKKHKIM